MPAIESGFRENFPEKSFKLDMKALKMSLYNYDISRSVYERKNKGFSSYDFVVELRAYLLTHIKPLVAARGKYSSV